VCITNIVLIGNLKLIESEVNARKKGVEMICRVLGLCMTACVLGSVSYIEAKTSTTTKSSSIKQRWQEDGRLVPPARLSERLTKADFSQEPVFSKLIDLQWSAANKSYFQSKFKSLGYVVSRYKKNTGLVVLTLKKNQQDEPSILAFRRLNAKAALVVSTDDNHDFRDLSPLGLEKAWSQPKSNPWVDH
jgi:hypothetical protein